MSEEQEKAEAVAASIRRGVETMVNDLAHAHAGATRTAHQLAVRTALYRCGVNLSRAGKRERDLSAALTRISSGSRDSGTTKEGLGAEARAAIEKARTEREGGGPQEPSEGDPGGLNAIRDRLADAAQELADAKKQFADATKEARAKQMADAQMLIDQIAAGSAPVSEELKDAVRGTVKTFVGSMVEKAAADIRARRPVPTKEALRELREYFVEKANASTTFEVQRAYLHAADMTGGYDGVAP